MSHWPWIQRTFHFDFPVGKLPDLLERVRGTPARLEDRVACLPREVLTRVPPAGWSIQENIGHLTDLGYLPLRRIEQILAGESVLIAADMKNEKTHAARHNERPITELLADFRAERAGLVALFESLSESDWGRSALHHDVDNCPDTFNPDHQDSDGDGVGDACDHCPEVSNPAQSDDDGDGIGNLCDEFPNGEDEFDDGSGSGQTVRPCGLCGNGAAAGMFMIWIGCLGLRSQSRRWRPHANRRVCSPHHA